MICNNVNWGQVLTSQATDIANELGLDIIVESFILEEIKDRIELSLKDMDIEKPNVAKIAGVVTFWVRKLKPFSYASEAIANGNKLHTLNELIAVQTGLAICNTYKDDYSLDDFHLSKRLLIDWLHSLRFHSHSPASTLFVFEILTTNQE